MKTLLGICFSLLTAIVILNFLPVNGEEQIYENTIRLHVIANSDSESDQELKMAVKDKIISEVNEKLSATTEKDTAYKTLDNMKDEIKSYALEVIAKEGYDYNVKVELGVEEYPTRYYDGFTLPSGNYNSMRITIGEGDGKNWWCILFPSICINNSVKAKEDYVAAGFTPDQYKVIENGNGRKYKVRFKVLEILSDFIGFDY